MSQGDIIGKCDKCGGVRLEGMKHYCPRPIAVIEDSWVMTAPDAKDELAGKLKEQGVDTSKPVKYWRDGLELKTYYQNTEETDNATDEKVKAWFKIAEEFKRIPGIGTPLEIIKELQEQLAGRELRVRQLTRRNLRLREGYRYEQAEHTRYVMLEACWKQKLAAAEEQQRKSEVDETIVDTVYGHKRRIELEEKLRIAVVALTLIREMSDPGEGVQTLESWATIHFKSKEALDEVTGEV